MPRKSPAALSARDKPADKKAPPAALEQPLPVVQLAVFAFAALVGLVLYFGDAPDLHLEQRRKSLVFLAAPDELFLMSCGGKLANFSFLDRSPIVLLTITILVAAWLAGRLALGALGVRSLLNRVERTVFALSAGLNLVSLYALAVGLAGGLHQRWLFIAPVALLLLANLRVPPVACPSVPLGTAGRASRGTLDDPRWLWGLLAAVPFALIILLGAMLPPWAYDVREYHLQAPKEWFQNGRIDFLPHNIYANMPLGSELTALWGMALFGGKDGWWWGALAGKTVMAFYSLIAAAGLVAIGRRIHSLAVGIIAAVIWLMAPWTSSLATAGYNEGPVALYALLSIFALWLAARDENRAHRWRFVALAGFLAGSAVACKYPPLLFVVVPLALCVLFSRRVGSAHRPTADEGKVGAAHPTIYLTIFLAAALAACGLWFAKNAVQTNNPTYPLLYSLFDGRTRTPEKDRQWMRAHSPQPDSQGQRFSLRQFLEQVAWNGWRTLWASLVIPPLAAVAWFSAGHRRLLTAIALWMLFVFTSWWLFTHRLDRFLVLLLPVASLVAAIGAFAVPHVAWRTATLIFVLCGAIVHFPFAAIHPDNRYFAPLEWLRRDDRELGNQGVRVEAAHRWLNEHAQPGERVLLLADAEPFDLEMPAIYNTCFDDCQFTRLFQGRTRTERLAALQAEKIAYVFCSWTHLARYRSPGNYGYTSDYPTRQLVHDELIRDQQLLLPIDAGTEPENAELFRIAEQ